MSGKPILEIKGLGKEYRLHGHSEPYKSLRDSLANVFRRGHKSKPETFWALEDIDLDIYAGDTIGIIGQNGAGKSTLLKILSKITFPTKGEIIARGRVASLLEVGTGFHPELSGRENIYLNGSILGLRKQEIERQFDAIVEFSGVSRFIDTSLKHYSSGMQLRLAFAVAAHLEPEILIIDEVLAVGDHEFQQKCLLKMKDVSEQGRTVIFVSHNMNALLSLCTKGVLLENGRRLMEGPISEVVTTYMERSNSTNDRYQFDGDIQEVSIRGAQGNAGIDFKEGIAIKVRFDMEQDLDHPVLGLVIRDEMGGPITGINNRHYSNENLVAEPIRKGIISVQIDGLSLVPGNYMLDVYVGDRNIDVAKIEGKILFKITDRPITPSGHDLNKSLNRIFPENVTWKIEH